MGLGLTEYLLEEKIKKISGNDPLTGDVTGTPNATVIPPASITTAKLAAGAATGTALGTDVRKWKAANLNRVRFKDQDFFVHGCNLAWLNYGTDFGGTTTNGVSNSTNQTTLDGWFAQMQSAGMNVVRWFVFPDGTRLNNGNRGTGTSLGTATGASYSSGTYTYTVASTAGLIARQSYVKVSGALPSGYNLATATLVDTVVDSTHFTVANQFTNPGTWTSGGAVTTGPDAWVNTVFVLDSNGYPIGLQQGVLKDFDTALALLKARGMRAEFVLFNHVVDLPQSKCVNDATGQQALLRVLTHLFSRYRNHPAVFSWALGNEWSSGLTDFWPTTNQESTRALLAAFAAAVHAASPQTLASTSAGSAADLAALFGLGFDYYSSSWYYFTDHSGDNGDPSAHTYAYYQSLYGLDAPLLIAECQVDNNNSSGITTTADATARYNYFYNNGYAGCWGWSATPSAADGMRIDWTAATNFAAGKTDLGPGPLV